MLILVLTIICLVILLVVFYDAVKIKKFNFIQKIKNKKLQWLISLMPILIILLLFDFVNASIIFIHLALFFLIANLIVYLIKRFFKKTFNFYLVGILAISFTIIYLGIGAYLDYHIFETKYSVFTNKELGQDNFRIIQISDSHIGTTFNGEEFYQIMQNISKIDSDLLVITGDFIDDDTIKEDMIKSCEALSLIKPKYGKYFVFGNHDKGYYNNDNENDLINELIKNDVVVLKDHVEKINDYIYIIGRNDRRYNRKSIDELTKDLDKNLFLIDLNHQPNDYENEMNKVDLVLSGHSHGGQLFPLGYIGLLFGSNNEFYGMHQRENTTFIVNSGISDWKVIFKTGTKSEYAIIDIKKEK